jgi:hypothetical protein
VLLALLVGAAAGCAGSVGVGAGSVGEVAGAALPGDDEAAAADADRLVSGSEALADPALPLMAAANAVMWVRTSCSFVRAGSSSVVAAPSREVVPAVPAVPVGAVAPVARSVPRSSVKVRSIAATGAAQLALLRSVERALVAGVPLALADCSSALICRFRSATRVLAVPVNEAAGMSFRAALALLRCSCAWASEPAGRLVVEAAGGVCCAAVEAGTASSVTAAHAIVHPEKRFIGGSS